jgi:pyrimidine-nucleoside phosphorylase
MTSFLSLIEAKRDGRVLTEKQIKDLIAAFVAGKIPDYQMAAFLMAVYFRGLDPVETATLTKAMRDSGDLLVFPDDPRPIVDKHSTGGVGDKVSLPLAPLLAALGFRVPMISGRGLGITGGTLDKLESIPGFKTNLTREQIIFQVQTLGCVICGQTERMVPADKLMYALRDVTGTVPSIELITASILSKKLAEGLKCLVLDVKYGNAAFMPTYEKAVQLARSMVQLGRNCGVNTRALITSMNVPTGRAAGNWLEVRESVHCLEGRSSDDLKHLVINCAAHLLVQGGKSLGLETARVMAAQCLESGKPLDIWNKMLAAQGADMEAYRAKLVHDSTAPVVREYRSPANGLMSGFNARIIGEIIRDLGGGRIFKESIIQPDVGIDRMAPLGDGISQGALLCRVHAMTEADADKAVERLKTAYEITLFRPEQKPSVEEVIGD